MASIESMFHNTPRILNFRKKLTALLPISASRRGVDRRFSDPLHKNSFFIMLASVTNAALGLLFWAIAVRLYELAEIGVATAMISSMSLLVFLSRVGLEHSLIRYFPEGDKEGVFFTTLVITGLICLSLAGILAVSTNRIFAGLILTWTNAAIFIGVVGIQSMVSVCGTALVALRKGGLYYFQNLVINTKILVLFPLVFLGALGILGALGLALAFALCFSMYQLTRLGIRNPRIDVGFLKKSIGFSVRNYTAEILTVTPNTLIPIIVLAVLGAEQTALYFISFSLASILMVIPSSLSTSLFVEGSHGQPLRKVVRMAASSALLLLVPAAALLCSVAGFVLGLIGPSFAQGLNLVIVMSASAFPASIIFIYAAAKRVQKDIRPLIMLTTGTFMTSILLSILFIGLFGILGVGYAWLTTYTVWGFIAIVQMKREELI